MVREDSNIRTVFISYSHTSDEYQNRVKTLVQDLANLHGIRGIADFNSLKPGEDKYHFMEGMVNNASIDKVLCLIDERYTERFDVRAGGIGTEAVLLTPVIYGDQPYEKADSELEGKALKVPKGRVIPVLFDVDREQKPVKLPAALESLIHVDLSTASKYAENIGMLENAVFDEAIVPLPVVRPRPERNARENNWWTYLPEAIKNTINKDQASLARGYFKELYDQYFNHCLVEYATPVDVRSPEECLKKLSSFARSREVIVDLWAYALRFNPSTLDNTAVRQLFNQLMSLHQGNDPRHYFEGKGQVDHMRLAIMDLLLHFVALFIQEEKFVQVDDFLQATFSYRLTPRDELKKGSFAILQEPLYLYQLYPEMEFQVLYRELLKPTQVEFNQLRDADLVLAVRHELTPQQNSYDPYWWPLILTYGRDYSRIHAWDGSIFKSRRTPKELEQLAVLLGQSSFDNLKAVLIRYLEKSKQIPYDWTRLCDVEELISLWS